MNKLFSQNDSNLNKKKKKKKIELKSNTYFFCLFVDQNKN